MEEIIIAVVRDLPSTAILILFIWFVAKQFNSATQMLSSHLEQLNKLIETCIRSKDIEEKEIELDRKIVKLEAMLAQVRSGIISTGD